MEVLADPTRLRLLRLLERHELGVAELCDVLQLPQSTVSRHLKVLGRPGLGPRAARRARANLYRMTLDDERPGRAPAVAARPRADRGLGHRRSRTSCASARLLAERQPDARPSSPARRGVGPAARRAVRQRASPQSALLALLPPHWVVADLGCGTGHSAAALAPHVAPRDRRRPVRRHAEGGAAPHGRRSTTSSCGGGASRRCRSTTASATPRC